jgi:bacterioferritin
MAKLGTNQAAKAADSATLDTEATVEVLNRILHFELDGVMQHFHHRWMSRWLRSSRARAITVGQQLSSLTGAPSMNVGDLIEDALVSSDRMLTAARSHEKRRVEEYRRLLELVEGRHDGLDAFARAQLEAEASDLPSDG